MGGEGDRSEPCGEQHPYIDNAAATHARHRRILQKWEGGSTDDLAPEVKFIYEIVLYFKEREMQLMVDRILSYVTIA